MASKFLRCRKDLRGGCAGFAGVLSHLQHIAGHQLGRTSRLLHISGILHVLKTGCRWRDVPAAYGPPTTIYNRYNRWSRRGIWQRLFEPIAVCGPVPDEVLIDSSHVKAQHQLSHRLGKNFGTVLPRCYPGYVAGAKHITKCLKNMARPKGFEPLTPRFVDCCGSLILNGFSAKRPIS
jgi:transposase